MLRAVNDNVILEKIKVEETTEGGLIINSNHFTPIYKVVDISDNNKIKEDDITPVKVGDNVVIHPNAGINLKSDGKTYRYVKSWEIEAIIDI
jgi:co-chaperonin GroES (HSP10)